MGGRGGGKCGRKEDEVRGRRGGRDWEAVPYPLANIVFFCYLRNTKELCDNMDTRSSTNMDIVSSNC